MDAGKLAEDAHCDGIFVFHANATTTTLNVMLKERKLLLEEVLSR